MQVFKVNGQSVPKMWKQTDGQTDGGDRITCLLYTSDAADE